MRRGISGGRARVGNVSQSVALVRVVGGDLVKYLQQALLVQDGVEVVSLFS